jgi:hypothetical protein
VHLLVFNVFCTYKIFREQVLHDCDICDGSASVTDILVCLLLSDTRETGFLNAITAAGVTFAVTRACTMGDLMECSCDKTTKGKKTWILHADDIHALMRT